jgi:ankyrin repeat protein
MTSLHIACLNGDLAIVDLLMKNGAETLCKDIVSTF